MCLDYLDEFEVKSNIGYQLMQLINGRLHNLFCDTLYPKKVNEWEFAEHINLAVFFIGMKNQYYTSGFHIFVDEKWATYYLRNKYIDYYIDYNAMPAEEIALVEVEFKNVKHTGYQNGCPVIVADQRKINCVLQICKL